MVVHFRVRAELRARAKSLVILKELSLQHAQAVELREQTPGSFADRPDRIVRMFGLPSGKILLRAREIQVVKPQESVVQRRVGVRIRCNRGTSPRLQSQDHAQGRHRTEDHFAKLREIWHHMNPSCFITVGFPDNATLLSFTPCFDATIPGSVCHIPVICQGGGPSFPQWI